MVNVPQSGVPLSGGGPASRDWYQFFTQLVRDVDGKIATSLLTARGQIIRRGASAPEALAAQTADTFLGGDGTDIGVRTAAQVRTSLLLAGTNYTPTGTGVTNVDSVTPGEANYIRVGSSVFVSFYAAVDATAAASTTTVFALSLPIASALTSARQLSGSGTTAGVWLTVDIEGDATNDRASLRYQSPVTTPIAITGVFGYRIL